MEEEEDHGNLWQQQQGQHPAVQGGEEHLQVEEENMGAQAPEIHGEGHEGLHHHEEPLNFDIPEERAEHHPLSQHHEAAVSQAVQQPSEALTAGQRLGDVLEHNAARAQERKQAEAEDGDDELARLAELLARAKKNGKDVSTLLSALGEDHVALPGGQPLPGGGAAQVPAVDAAGRPASCSVMVTASTASPRCAQPD